MCSHRAYCAILFGSYTEVSTCVLLYKRTDTSLLQTAPLQKFQTDYLERPSARISLLSNSHFNKLGFMGGKTKRLQCGRRPNV